MSIIFKMSYMALNKPQELGFTKLFSCLLHLGFLKSQVDYFLFTYHHRPIHVYLFIHVDDISVIGTHASFISKLITSLHVEFTIKDLGPIHYFPGIQVSQVSLGLFLSQTSYIVELLHRSNMAGAKSCLTPLSSGDKLTSSIGEPLEDPTSYRQVVGALQYCTLSQPDITIVVNLLC